MVIKQFIDKHYYHDRNMQFKIYIRNYYLFTACKSSEPYTGNYALFICVRRCQGNYRNKCLALEINKLDLLQLYTIHGIVIIVFWFTIKLKGFKFCEPNEISCKFLLSAYNSRIKSYSRTEQKIMSALKLQKQNGFFFWTRLKIGRN